MVSARDQYHAEADLLFRELIAAGRRLHTSNLVVAEVHRLILFRVGIPAARSVLNLMEQSERLEIVQATVAHHSDALAWLDQRPDQVLTYTDAISFAMMEALGCTEALTFDRDFEIAGFLPIRSDR